MSYPDYEKNCRNCGDPLDEENNCHVAVEIERTERCTCLEDGHGCCLPISSCKWWLRMKLTDPNADEREIRLSPGKCYLSEKIDRCTHPACTDMRVEKMKYDKFNKLGNYAE